MNNIIEIDGSFGEGGGQIVRTAVALSALTNKPVKVFNIRAKRKNPGLSYQHLTAINSVAEICDAEIKGLWKGSSVIEFYPKKINHGVFDFDVGTAGSVTLVLQCCLLPGLFADEKTKIKIRGGTDVKWSPPVDYFSHVFLEILSKMGVKTELKIIKRGCYPKGGGEINVNIEPVKELKGLDLSQTKETKNIKGTVFISNLPEHILKRMKDSALKKLLGYDVNIKDEIAHSFSPGAGITLWTDTLLGSSCLGELGIPAERVGESAANNLLGEIKSGATLDVYASDQILPYLVLAKNKSVFLTRKISMHAETNMWLIKKFVDVRFDVKEQNGLKRVETIPNP
ncbi:MAG: RNA 3'-terminal phosphate cyclase [Thermoplasmatales archaeon]|nr:RNA 3'-terminal phosphate cyclase [Thermoplasmatales archaeon]